MTPRLFLLRANGDFVIALRAVLLSRQPAAIKIIASNHLYPLFEAIAASKSVLGSGLDISSLDIHFENFGIKGSQLNLFTKRHLLSIQTIRQIQKIKEFLKKQHNKEKAQDLLVNYLEQKNRKYIFQQIVGQKFASIVNQKQVYAAYNQFFDIQEEIFQNQSIIHEANLPKGKMLILPDARISKRNIPTKIIQLILEEAKKKDLPVQVAYFKRVGINNYQNFKELIALIVEADFVVGADSLPVHLCQLFNKPHYILYPKNVQKHFFTPFALKRNKYASFDQFLVSDIM